jgi:hypothetical protein
MEATDCLGGFGISRKVDLRNLFIKFKMIREEDKPPAVSNTLDLILDQYKREATKQGHDKVAIEKWRNSIDERVFREIDRPASSLGTLVPPKFSNHTHTHKIHLAPLQIKYV